MPGPPQRIVTNSDGTKSIWEHDGTVWVPTGKAPDTPTGPSMPMINVPRGTYTPEQVQANIDQGNWWLKNLLMTGGMLAGPGVAAVAGNAALRLPLMIAGAATGRMAGAAPEIFAKRSSGPVESRPTWGQTAGQFGDEGAQGAMEGAAGEIQSRAAGPVLKYGGKVMQGVGKYTGDIPGMTPYQRAMVATTRGGLVNWMGGHGWGGAAAVGPILATELGKKAEAAGARMMTQPGLAEGLGGAWESLLERLGVRERPILPTPTPTHADVVETLRAAANGRAAQRATTTTGTGFRPGSRPPSGPGTEPWMAPGPPAPEPPPPGFTPTGSGTSQTPPPPSGPGTQPWTITGPLQPEPPAPITPTGSGTNLTPPPPRVPGPPTGSADNLFQRTNTWGPRVQAKDVLSVEDLARMEGVGATPAAAAASGATPLSGAGILADQINPMSPGELWGRRLFRGDLDNELTRTGEVNVPAEHFDAAMAYAKKRLGIE